MALRLSGEEFSIVRGLDDYGWLKEIRRSTSDQALLLRQDGSGYILALYKGSSLQAVFDYGPSLMMYGPIRGYGNLTLETTGGASIVLGSYGAVKVDARVPLANTGAENNGNVAVESIDDIEMLGNQKGLIVRTSTGARYRIRVDNSGSVVTDAL